MKYKHIYDKLIESEKLRLTNSHMIKVLYIDRNNYQKIVLIEYISTWQGFFHKGNSLTFCFSPFIYKIVDIIFLNVGDIFNKEIRVYVKATEFKTEYIDDEEYLNEKKDNIGNVKSFNGSAA